MTDFWIETLIPTIVLAFIAAGVGFLGGYMIGNDHSLIEQCEILGGIWHEGQCQEVSGPLDRISE